jgi:hypothetical protein
VDGEAVMGATEIVLVLILLYTSLINARRLGVELLDCCTIIWFCCRTMLLRLGFLLFS